MSAYRHSVGEVMDAVAAKLGIDGWKGYRWEMAEGGFIVHGCVPDGVYQRGKNKGRPRYSRPVAGTQRTVVVTESEMDALAAAYEAETGNCYQCKGTSQQYAGWSAAEGTRYRACTRCGATGKAKAAA